MNVVDLCERGWVPDRLLRAGMQRLIAERLASEYRGGREAQQRRFRSLLNELAEGPVALSVDLANQQHYEVPADFFQLVLGEHLKYSCCYFPDGVKSLNEAEAAMLDLTCTRAEIEDGMDILELGCGWGAATLWMASHFPNSSVTAVSNSAGQRDFITERCRRLNLKNVRIITADMNDFSIDTQFDRVVSIEMFEHMRNYAVLNERISRWLRPDGKLFVHIFCHRKLMYPFAADGNNDWMARNFFTNGLMPAQTTLHYFQEHLRLQREWELSGQHYQKTCNAWLANLDNNRAEVEIALRAYGDRASLWTQRWRMFFMACAELFGYSAGDEWFVAHYLFVKPA